MRGSVRAHRRAPQAPTALDKPASLAKAPAVDKVSAIEKGAGGDRGSGKTGLTTLNRLHCFEVVVQEAGFKRATAKLHITQPALSYQMKHLEEELGVQLFHRRPGGVSLTDAGRLLFTHAQRVSAAVKRAERAVKELPAVGEVRIGTVNSIGTYFLPQVLATVRERHAATLPILYRARSDEFIEALLANHVDLAILADPRVDKRLRYETLFEERVSLVAGRGHPLFESPPLRAQQLEGAQFVSLSQQTPTGALIGRYLDRLAVKFERVVSTEDVETVKRMVEMGMGVAFLPDMVTERDLATKANPGGRLRRIPVDPPLTRRVVLVTWNEVPASRAVAAFVDEVRRLSSSWPVGAVKSQG
jgi:DNA-binding transcriptional LysR family regulator